MRQYEVSALLLKHGEVTGWRRRDAAASPCGLSLLSRSTETKPWLLSLTL